MHCPFCYGQEASQTGSKVVEDCLIREMECPRCDSTWEDVWAFVEVRNPVDGRQMEPDKLDQKTINMIKAWK